MSREDDDEEADAEDDTNDRLADRGRPFVCGDTWTLESVAAPAVAVEAAAAGVVAAELVALSM